VVRTIADISVLSCLVVLIDQFFVVDSVEVDCAMTHEFYEQYLKESSQQQRMKMQVMNPNKFRACEYLVRRHEHRGDKVMVFADNIFALKEYARRLKRPAIWGNTSPNERETLLHDFKSNPNMNCLLISSIGDNSLDLPDVNVIIQISSHFAARRQEAQRLGRILRPKPRMDDNFNAFFYTLISTDTREMYYASKRQVLRLHLFKQHCVLKIGSMNCFFY
jgi:DNA excision repair protein ERCC-3